LKSRSFDSCAELIDAITADKLKDALSPGALRYVLGLQGDDCYASHKIALLISIVVIKMLMVRSMLIVSLAKHCMVLLLASLTLIRANLL